MSTSATEYLTVDEAAKLLRVSISTIRRWIRAGAMPAHRVGGRRILLKREELVAAVRALDPTHPAGRPPNGHRQAPPPTQAATGSAATAASKSMHRSSGQSGRRSVERDAPEQEQGQSGESSGDDQIRRTKRQLGVPDDPAEFDLGPAADILARFPRVHIEDRPLTSEEQKRMRAALARTNELREKVGARLGGATFPPSWQLINEARDERTRQLNNEDPEPDRSNS